MAQAAWWMSVPGSTIGFQTALQGSEIATEDNHGQQINSQLSREVVSAYKLICLKHGRFSCHHVSSLACGMFSCPVLNKIGVTEVTSPTQYLNCSLFCRAGWANVSGDLINTWRLCKPLRCALITASLHPIGISRQFFMSINSLECVLGQTDQRCLSRTLITTSEELLSHQGKRLL